MPKKRPPTLTARVARLERWLAPTEKARSTTLEKRFAKFLDEVEPRHALAISAMDDRVEELRNRLNEVENVGDRIMAERLTFGAALQGALRSLCTAGNNNRSE